MTRLATLIWMLVVVVAAFLLYMAKYQVQTLQTQVIQAERQLESEKESLHVVNAEWAYLNRPERLRMLAAKYLSSGSLTVDQIAEIQAIPFPGHREARAEGEGNIHPASATIEKDSDR